MAPKWNDACLLTPCLRHRNLWRKSPNLAMDQFVQGIQKISITQERSSGWLRDSFKNDFLEVETMLLRALFATPFLNEDGFGDSLRHSWGKECIGFQETITQDELLQYFPLRYSPYLKPDETTQDLPFQERRYPFLQRLFIEPSLLQAELLNGMSEPKGWGRHKWFKENPMARILHFSEDRLLRLHACLLLGLPPNPDVYYALLHAWGIARGTLSKKLNRWEKCLLQSPVLLSKPPEDAHSSPSGGLLSLLRSPRKRAARSPPSTPSLRSPSPQRANRNSTPSPSTFNSSTPSRTKRILNFMRSSPRQQENILEEQELSASETVESPCARMIPKADEPEDNCVRIRLVFGDNESDKEMECNPDDASSESSIIDPPIVTPTATGDNACDEEMENNSEASSGSIDPPTRTSSANNFGASKEKYPLLSKYTTENEFHQEFEEYVAFALETNKKEAVQKLLSGIIETTVKMANKKP